MKILLVGATGAIGSRLVPMLIDAGHEVVGTATTGAKLPRLEQAGASGVVMDILDPSAVRAAVRAVEPDVIVHQATALSAMSGNMRRFDADFAVTNQLRTQGTEHLVAAARDVGVPRFIAQSFGGWPYARIGGPVKTEDDPLDPNPPAAARNTLAAIRHLEGVVGDIGGLVLRYGFFYGPGTSLAPGGPHLELIRKRRFPLVGPGTGVWSFIHTEDAASATAAAIDRGAPGPYNIVDDEPAPVSVWLPYLSELLGVRPPMRVPVWVGRLAAGDLAVTMMTEIRGSSNEKARQALSWKPRYASWRDGFAALVGRPAR